MNNKLNALVAERVMGWMRQSRMGNIWFVNGESHTRLPNYSGSISDAWKVVEKLSTLFRCEIVCIPRYFPSVRFADSKRTGVAAGGAVSQAICRAALRAVGVTEAEIEEAMR